MARETAVKVRIKEHGAKRATTFYVRTFERIDSPIGSIWVGEEVMKDGTPPYHARRIRVVGDDALVSQTPVTMDWHYGEFKRTA